MNLFILNIKFLFSKILCHFLRIDILKITEPPVPECPYPDVMKLIEEESTE